MYGTCRKRHAHTHTHIQFQWCIPRYFLLRFTNETAPYTNEASFVSETQTEKPKTKTANNNNNNSKRYANRDNRKNSEKTTALSLSFGFVFQSLQLVRDYPFWFRVNWLALAFYSQLAQLIGLLRSWVSVAVTVGVVLPLLLLLLLLHFRTWVLLYCVIKKPNNGAQFANHKSAAIASKLGDDTETTERTTAKSWNVHVR